LIDRTEGNPFFIEECVRAFVETGVLVGPRGARRRALEVEGIRVPDTVEAVLAARIDRLSPEHKRLLQSAAVIGREVPFALLETVTEEADVDIRPGLAVLQSGEFLYESSMIPDLQYMFKHALTQEVAYKALLQERRLPLHGQVVAGLERLYADNLFPHLERLSYHAFRGQLWEKAATFSRRAGSKAIARSASRQAVVCFEQALAALGHLEESRRAHGTGPGRAPDLQSALVPLGHLERMLESLRAAERLAERLGGQSRLGRVHAYMAHCFWWAGEPARAVESCQRSLAIAAESGDSGLAMVSNVRLGQASFALGRYRQVVQCAASLRRSGREGQEPLPLSGIAPTGRIVTCRPSEARSGARGDFRVGVETGKHAGKLAEQAEHPYSMVIAYWALGDIYVTQGRCEPAIDLLEQAARMCTAGKFALMVPIVDRHLGEAYCLSGRGDEGVRLLEAAVQDLAAVQFMPALPGAYASLGEGYLMVGRLEEARRTAERARELCIAHEQEATEALASLAQGSAWLSRESTGRDEGVLRRSLGTGTRARESTVDGPLCPGPESSRARGRGTRARPGTSRCGGADVDGDGHDTVASRGPGRPGEPHVHRIAFGPCLYGGAMAAPEYHGYRYAGPRTQRGKGKDFDSGTVTWTVDIARVYALGRRTREH
jgi:tetratricopeptide (TPR) repeat protein